MPPFFTPSSATSPLFGSQDSPPVFNFLQSPFPTNHHTGAFATWAPHLYTYYVDHLGPLFKTYPRLQRNFLNSVFACATFNFGPVTCCFDHVDSGNLLFGWCAITALGTSSLLSNSPRLYGAGHLVTATFGQWPIWPPKI